MGVLESKEDATARCRLVDICLGQQRIEEAISHLRALIGINPRDANAWRRLANLLQQIADRDGKSKL